MISPRREERKERKIAGLFSSWRSLRLCERPFFSYTTINSAAVGDGLRLYEFHPAGAMAANSPLKTAAARSVPVRA
jgi:hypothetical protein